jgi:hypothetical protein
MTKPKKRRMSTMEVAQKVVQLRRLHPSQPDYAQRILEIVGDCTRAELKRVMNLYEDMSGPLVGLPDEVKAKLGD